MKKYSSLMKESSRQTFNKHIIRVAVLAAVLLLLLTFTPRILQRAVSIVAIPLVRLEMWFQDSGSMLPSYLRDQNALIAERDTLRRQLADTANVALTHQQLTEENSRLLSLLNNATGTRIAAGVIGRPTALPYDVFLIDRGQNDGVVEGAPVYISEHRAIGFIARTFPNSSLVALATTPGYESTVYIYGPNIYTTAVGMGSGTLRVSVPQGIALAENDLVVMPSLDRGVFGFISVIDSVPSRPEQYGYVSIEEPLASIRYVAVGAETLASIDFETAKEIVESVRADFLEVPVPSGMLIDVESTATSTATTTTDIP